MRKDKIISLVFVGILLAGFLWNILTPVRAYSERENRYLQGRPTLSMDRVLSGQFGKDFETYTTDQFPMRDAWVSLKTMAGLAMLRPDNGRVYFGKQHRLFEIPEPADAALQEKNCLAVAGFLEKVTREYPEIRASVLLAPTATTVLEGALPACAPVADEAGLILRQRRALGESVVFCDPTPALLGQLDRESLYYRTDHHWTSLGAYYAYCAWRGIQPNADEWTQEILCGNFRGTTWNKVPLPTVPAEEIAAWYKHINRSVSYNNGQYETDSIYERKYLSGSDQYAVFLNSNQAQTVIEGSGKSGKLLLIKDSYGNTFSQSPVEDYAEVHVLDLRFFKGDAVDYAKENGITDALVLYGVQNFVKDTNLRF